ncbi:MAG: AI-2E family transporter [Gemmatimonadota bacterium]|nr:AI-2E family transporter [Gemmatimonadota bacterium]
MIDSRTDASADTRLPEPSNKARRSASIIVALLAVATALHFGADFFIPVTFGLVLTGVLWPVVKKLERWHIPTPAGAAISVLGAGAILVAVITAFGPPLRAFSNELPRTIAAARPKLAAISTALARYTSPQPRRRTTPAATTKPKTKADSMAPPPADSGVIAVMKSAVAAVTDSQAAPATDSAGKAQRKPETADSVRTPRSRVATPATPAQGASTAGAIPSSITSGAPATITHALSVALGMLADFVEVVLFALFILALSNHWSDKLAIAIPNAERRAGVADAINEMRSVVSRFLVVISLINIVQASIVAFSLYLLGYPSVLLWGVLAFLFEFIPYFGGMVMIGMLFLAGLAAGKDFGAALSGPGAYLVITSIQNNLVAPITYGRRLRVNPAAILASLMLWFMIWGVAGAFLAVPLLAAFNVLAARVPSLKGVSAFISD